MPWLVITAVILLATSAIGQVGAVVAEHKKREPIYLIAMKVFLLMFAVGAVLLSIGIAIGKGGI